MLYPHVVIASSPSSTLLDGPAIKITATRQSRHRRPRHTIPNAHYHQNQTRVINQNRYCLLGTLNGRPARSSSTSIASFTTDEKEEIDLPILKLTPEPPVPDQPPSLLAVQDKDKPSSASSKGPSKAAEQGKKISSSIPHKESTVLSSVPGIKSPLAHTNSLTKLPKYGVETSQELELEEVMNCIDHWGLDMFRVRELSNGHPLVSVFYTILKVSTFAVMLYVIPIQNVEYLYFEMNICPFLMKG